MSTAFYNYVLKILKSVIEITNNLILSEDFVTVEIRGDTLNVSSHIQLVTGNCFRSKEILPIPVRPEVYTAYRPSSSHNNFQSN